MNNNYRSINVIRTEKNSSIDVLLSDNKFMDVPVENIGVIYIVVLLG